MNLQYEKQGGQRAAGMGEVEDDWDATPCVARAQRKRSVRLEALPLESVENT